MIKKRILFLAAFFVVCFPHVQIAHAEEKLVQTAHPEGSMSSYFMGAYYEAFIALKVCKHPMTLRNVDEEAEGLFKMARRIGERQANEFKIIVQPKIKPEDDFCNKYH